MSYPKYEDVLEHTARPEDDRIDAARVRLSDFEALFIQELLVEYAAYSARTAAHENIALGYAQYINKVIRDEGKDHVYLYAHTTTAKQTLYESITHTSQTEYLELQQSLADRVKETFGVYEVVDDGE